VWSDGGVVPTPLRHFAPKDITSQHKGLESLETVVEICQHIAVLVKV